jgi:hypothetical protein
MFDAGDGLSNRRTPAPDSNDAAPLRRRRAVAADDDSSAATAKPKYGMFDAGDGLSNRRTPAPDSNDAAPLRRRRAVAADDDSSAATAKPKYGVVGVEVDTTIASKGTELSVADLELERVFYRDWIKNQVKVQRLAILLKNVICPRSGGKCILQFENE